MLILAADWATISSGDHLLAEVINTVRAEIEATSGGQIDGAEAEETFAPRVDDE